MTKTTFKVGDKVRVVNFGLDPVYWSRPERKLLASSQHLVLGKLLASSFIHGPLWDTTTREPVSVSSMDYLRVNEDEIELLKEFDNVV